MNKRMEAIYNFLNKGFAVGNQFGTSLVDQKHL